MCKSNHRKITSHCHGTRKIILKKKKELEPSKPREDPTPIQHHTTYCQEEPFVETQNLFLHFARADFRDVDLRGACSV